MFPEDLSLVPNTHIRQLIIAYNARCRESDTAPLRTSISLYALKTQKQKLKYLKAAYSLCEQQLL